MNGKSNTPKNQVGNRGGRIGGRDSKRKKNDEVVLNPEQEAAMKETAAEISNGLLSFTWRDLESRGKFSRNEKLTFIRDDMLIVGCDIGSETHYARAIDTKGRELSQGAFSFENNAEGFRSAKDWALQLAVQHEKNQIVLGLEPTGHYWFSLAAWMIANGISVVQVNPYAVKQTKELEDNSQAKNDAKDPKLIADLVKNGNYGMPYLPEDVYADLRVLCTLRDQLTEDRVRNMNRLHREMKIVFPEYKEAFGKVDGIFTLSILAKAPLPRELVSLGEDGVKAIWHAEKLRGGGYKRAKEIVRLAGVSAGVTQGAESRKLAIVSFVSKILDLTTEIEEIEVQIAQKCREVPRAENVLEIKGLGDTIVSGILAEMGDIDRFDAAKEIQKLSGLGLVACSSGKHKGQTKISHRGRKRLRYWLFQGAMSVVSHNAAFRQIHEYYTTRTANPLKKMQSITVIACKLLRIIFTILKKGIRFDPEKMMRDIVYPTQQEAAA
jgi:transposase